MTITPDDDRPVDPYVELIDEDTPAERIDADDRAVPLDDEG
jgi:hypothetical protein